MYLGDELAGESRLIFQSAISCEGCPTPQIIRVHCVLFSSSVVLPSSHRIYMYINKTKAMPKRPMPPFDQQEEERAMVMSSSVMGELTIKTEDKFDTEEDDDDDDEDSGESMILGFLAKNRASSLLEVYLGQAAEHYPLIGAIDLGSKGSDAVSYLGMCTCR